MSGAGTDHTLTVVPGGCQCSDETEVVCGHCGLDPLCRVLDYASAESGVPGGILLRRRPVARGEIIFSRQEPSSSIFAVKSGSIKTFVPGAKSPDQVLGFYLAGELVGAETLAAGRYPCSARALEAGSVCELRLARLPESGRPLAALQQAVIEVLGDELAVSRRLLATLVHQSAEKRVVSFLLNISDRLQRHGMPCSEFNLSMSRSDIGSYLGLAGETVSRVLGRLHEKGQIQLHRKRILMRRKQQLQAFVRSAD